jgi:hypothetical protein
MNISIMGGSPKDGKNCRHLFVWDDWCSKSCVQGFNYSRCLEECLFRHSVIRCYIWTSYNHSGIQGHIGVVLELSLLGSLLILISCDSDVNECKVKIGVTCLCEIWIEANSTLHNLTCKLREVYNPMWDC